jgi:hypothetical protein
MGRRSAPTYLTPLLSDGTLQKQDVDGDVSGGEGTGRGWYLLAAGTYYYVLPCGDGTISSVHLQHDTAVAASSVAIETGDLGKSECADHSNNAGEWFREDPTDAYVPTDGAGTTATQAVVAIVAGNKGGARWNVSDLGASRARLAIVVTTPGKVRVACAMKD